MSTAATTPGATSPKLNLTIGVPTEVKPHENRVGMTPDGAREFGKKGHTVYVQAGAGVNTGFSDEAYQESGALILPTAEAIYSMSDLIIKVKEPLPQEYILIRDDQIVFTYFHFAANQVMTDAMLKCGAICIAYETIAKDGQLPLLVPMSEVAGRMAVQQGSKYLEKAMGGLGCLLGGVPGVAPAKVLILGGGVVGTEAAKVAAGMLADVTIMDVNLPRMRYISDILPRNVRTIYNTEGNLLNELKSSDVVIGAVLIAGRKAPKLVRREHLKLMKNGAVIVDVAVDQGGCIETCHPTTHDNPTYVVDGVVHYCVANMPGGVPFTSTMALTNATLKYALALARFGWRDACKEFPELKSGLNVVKGKVYHPGVADAFDYQSYNIEDLLDDEVIA